MPSPQIGSCRIKDKLKETCYSNHSSQTSAHRGLSSPRLSRRQLGAPAASDVLTSAEAAGAEAARPSSRWSSSRSMWPSSMTRPNGFVSMSAGFSSPLTFK